MCENKNLLLFFNVCQLSLCAGVAKKRQYFLSGQQKCTLARQTDFPFYTMHLPQDVFLQNVKCFVSKLDEMTMSDVKGVSLKCPTHSTLRILSCLFSIFELSVWVFWPTIQFLSPSFTTVSQLPGTKLHTQPLACERVVLIDCMQTWTQCP